MNPKEDEPRTPVRMIDIKDKNGVNWQLLIFIRASAPLR